MTNILRDDQLSGASEEELRAHYTEAAERHFAELGLSDQPHPTAEETAKAFARFVGAPVVYVSAAEAGGTAHLFQPLTPEELREVSSWSLGSFK